MADVTRNATSGSCTIVDFAWYMWMAVLFITGFLLIIACICFGLALVAKDQTMRLIIGLVGIVPVALAIWVFLLAKTHSKGHIVDVKNDILEFPKGFNIKRYQVRLSEIREINMRQDSEVWTDNQGKIRTNRYNILDINGDFGLHSLFFGSDDKRNELYSAITRINKLS